MQHLWAPWRMEYIVGEAQPGCIFCNLPATGDDRGALIIARREHVFAILNRFPYNNGHTMVCPYRHVADLAELTADERRELFDLGVEVIAMLREVMRPQGFNLGVNLGRTAGAGIAEHVHQHIVPRWDGDTNFMPVTGLAKVISQHLTETFDLLAPRLVVGSR